MLVLPVKSVSDRAWAFQAIPTAQLPNAIKPGAGATGILSTHGNKNGYSGRVTNQNVQTNKTLWHKDWPDWCYSGTLTTKAPASMAMCRIEAIQPSLSSAFGANQICGPSW